MEDPSKTNKPDDVVQSSVWESPNKRWLEAARLCSYQSICSPLSTIWYWHRWVLNLTKTRCFYIFNFCHSFQWVPITLSTIPEVHYPCVHPLVTSFIYLGLCVAHAHLHSSSTLGLYTWRETNIHSRSNQDHISHSGSTCSFPLNT